MKIGCDFSFNFFFWWWLIMIIYKALLLGFVDWLYLLAAFDGANRGCDNSSFKNAFVASFADGWAGVSFAGEPFNELLFILPNLLETGGAASNNDFSLPFTVDFGPVGFGNSGDSSRDDGGDFGGSTGLGCSTSFFSSTGLVGVIGFGGSTGFIGSTIGLGGSTTGAGFTGSGNLGTSCFGGWGVTTGFGGSTLGGVDFGGSTFGGAGFGVSIGLGTSGAFVLLLLSPFSIAFCCSPNKFSNHFQPKRFLLAIDEMEK